MANFPLQYASLHKMIIRTKFSPLTIRIGVLFVGILQLMLLWSYPLRLKSQNSQKAISILQAEERKQHCRIAMLVTELSSGKRIVDYRRNCRMIPASLTKLITTASALRIHGPEACFRTEIGYTGSIHNKELYGDLVVLGSGDPSIDSHYIAEDSIRFKTFVCETVSRAGITRIRGKIIVDASVFRPADSSSSWLYEDLGEYYGASLYGFNIHDNRIDIYLRNEGNKILLHHMQPSEVEIELINELKPGEKNSWHINGAPGEKKRRLRGTLLTKGRREMRCMMDIPDPAGYIATAIRKQLQKEGVKIEGPSEARYDYLPEWHGSVKSLSFYHSRSLEQLVRETNRRSINLWAEAFMNCLDENIPKSFDGGYNRLLQYWETVDQFDPKQISLFDGSGLSPKNRITPNLLEVVLLEMGNRKKADNAVFYNSLPLAGQEGSVQHFTTPQSMKARLKSGSMFGVQGYAGYAQIGGKDVTIVLLANDFVNVQSMRKTMLEALQTLSGETEQHKKSDSYHKRKSRSTKRKKS
ncbi:D-alanyl-D-alanine carboxypeptidase/D-alanyl-D-alanine endopeptidase [Porphyromonas crevioricanis]|nr:D-alanyl-D-alanine carboxypeptidase/D-alanyl-D-alanine-endopeptidase [Porphyromonas crevioricanis]